MSEEEKNQSTSHLKSDERTKMECKLVDEKVLNYYRVFAEKPPFSYLGLVCKVSLKNQQQFGPLGLVLSVSLIFSWLFNCLILKISKIKKNSDREKF